MLNTVRSLLLLPISCELIAVVINKLDIPTKMAAVLKYDKQVYVFAIEINQTNGANHMVMKDWCPQYPLISQRMWLICSATKNI